MNMIGWLGGGGSAPVVIGWVAQKTGLGAAISLAAAVYAAAGLLLIAGVVRIHRAPVSLR